MQSKSPEPFERGLKQLAEEQPPLYHYERTMAVARERTFRKDRTMKRTMQFAAFAGAVVVIFAAMLLIPVTYEVEVGSLVTVRYNTQDITPAFLDGITDKMEGLMNYSLAMQGEETVVNFGFQDIPRDEASERVNEYLAEAGILAGTYQLASEPVTVEVGGNAFAAVTGVTIVGSNDMTDEEIEALIAQRLAEAGAVVGGVQVTRNGDEMTFEIELDEIPGDSINIQWYSE